MQSYFPTYGWESARLNPPPRIHAAMPRLILVAGLNPTPRQKKADLYTLRPACAIEAAQVETCVTIALPLGEH